jgi:hypothetical protein
VFSIGTWPVFPNHRACNLHRFLQLLGGPKTTFLLALISIAAPPASAAGPWRLRQLPRRQAVIDSSRPGPGGRSVRSLSAGWQLPRAGFERPGRVIVVVAGRSAHGATSPCPDWDRSAVPCGPAPACEPDPASSPRRAPPGPAVTLGDPKLPPDGPSTSVEGRVPVDEGQSKLRQ